MRVELDDQEQIEIGFAPLIDCIFLLLIFFLVATSFKQQEKLKEEIEVVVDLPVAEASFNSAKAKPNPLVLVVDAEGVFYWNNTQVSPQQLRNRLREEKQSNPNRRIRIDGDKATDYQHIVHMLDICQFEGFTNIGMHTRN